MIDRNRLIELQEEIGPDVLADIAVLFLDESDQLVARLLQEQNLPPVEIGKRLHFLKGSAMNLGLSDLVDCCREGERRASCGAAQPLDAVQLSQIYEASKSAFLAALTTLGPE